MIETEETLVGYISPGIILSDVEIIRHWLEGTTLFVRLNNEQTLEIDITQYVDDLTESKLDAIENMSLYIENGELIFEYDENLIGVDFRLELLDLIVDDMDLNVDFEINENKELEVKY